MGKNNGNSKSEIQGSLHCGGKAPPSVEMMFVVGGTALKVLTKASAKADPFGDDKQEKQRQRRRL
ncbi:MAG TPA: hypothetical protein VK578_19215 [Edaphobacter sp.]|nr:hypothetical protein [Edaphobacter sp.]